MSFSIPVRCTCGARFGDDLRYCPECGRSRNYVQRELEQLAAVSGEPIEELERQDRAGTLTLGLPLDIRTRRLQRVVAELSRRNYEIVSQTDSSVQMHRRKQFSWLIALILLIVTAGVGLLFYLLYLIAVTGDLIYLTVDERGTVAATGKVAFGLLDLVRELNETA